MSQSSGNDGGKPENWIWWWSMPGQAGGKWSNLHTLPPSPSKLTRCFLSGNAFFAEFDMRIVDPFFNLIRTFFSGNAYKPIPRA